MKFDIAHHLPENFDNSSRVWIYQANRLFQISEALEIETILKQFVTGWQSHGTPVKGYANLFYGRFLVFMADETAAGVSGCSTDSSVRVVKQIEQQFKTDMFDRQLLCFMKNDKIEQLPLNQLSYAIANGFIKDTDLYFDNTVATKDALINKWPSPAGETWLQRMFVNTPG
jgi:hypothetical protein